MRKSTVKNLKTGHETGSLIFLPCHTRGCWGFLFIHGPSTWIYISIYIWRHELWFSGHTSGTRPVLSITPDPGPDHTSLFLHVWYLCIQEWSTDPSQEQTLTGVCKYLWCKNLTPTCKDIYIYIYTCAHVMDRPSTYKVLSRYPLRRLYGKTKWTYMR